MLERPPSNNSPERYDTSKISGSLSYGSPQSSGSISVKTSTSMPSPLEEEEETFKTPTSFKAQDFAKKYLELLASPPPDETEKKNIINDLQTMLQYFADYAITGCYFSAVSGGVNKKATQSLKDALQTGLIPQDLSTKEQTLESQSFVTHLINGKPDYDTLHRDFPTELRRAIRTTKELHDPNNISLRQGDNDCAIPPELSDFLKNKPIGKVQKSAIDHSRPPVRSLRNMSIPSSIPEVFHRRSQATETHENAAPSTKLSAFSTVKALFTCCLPSGRSIS